VKRVKNQHDSVKSAPSATTKIVLNASENETVSFVIANFVSVTFVIVNVVSVTFVIVNFVRTKVLHFSTTSLTLYENVNTPLSFCLISLTESLKGSWLSCESAIDHENAIETVSLRDGDFPLSFAFLKKAFQILTYCDRRFLNVFSLWSDVFL